MERQHTESEKIFTFISEKRLIFIYVKNPSNPMAKSYKNLKKFLKWIEKLNSYFSKEDMQISKTIIKSANHTKNPKC